jgi:hypothetical protein
MAEYCSESDKGYVLGKSILSSLPSLIDTLDNEDLNGFQKQEIFEKIILGLEIVNKIGIEKCNDVKKLLIENGLQ